jgi:hypothetical protein
MTEYSFCETLAAYAWHIRPLTAKGRKLSGGADTKTLCGLEAAWDIKAPILIADRSSGVCRKCVTLYQEDKQ